jgi:hypothetical protein
MWWINIVGHAVRHMIGHMMVRKVGYMIGHMMSRKVGHMIGYTLDNYDAVSTLMVDPHSWARGQTHDWKHDGTTHCRTHCQQLQRCNDGYE